MELETPGRRLRVWLDSRFGTDRAFAEAVGISAALCSQYVNDKKEPGLGQLMKFAGAGLNLHWYATGRGEMDAPNTVAEYRTRAAETFEQLRALARELAIGVDELQRLCGFAVE